MNRILFLITLILLSISSEVRADNVLNNNATWGGKIAIENSTGDMVFTMGGVERARIQADGTFKTTAGIKVGNATTCNGSNYGMLRYVAATDTWNFCDGVTWNTFSLAGTSCSVLEQSVHVGNLVAPASTQITRKTQIVTDNCTAQTAISGSCSQQYRICSDEACTSVVQNWTSSNSTIANGNWLEVRGTSPATANSSCTMTMRVGGANFPIAISNHAARARMFITSTTYTGDLGGLGGADYICQSRAAAAGLTGKFLPWLSDYYSSSPSYRGLENSSNRLYMPNGTQVSAGSMSMEYPINRDEFGNLVTTNLRAWTNPSNSDAETYCNYWTSQQGSGPSGSSNKIGATGSLWSMDAFAGCKEQLRLYCMEKAPENIGTAGVDYRRAFVTANTYNGNLGGVAGANAKCQAEATAASLPGIYKAYISGDIDAIDNLDYLRVPYRMLNGDLWTEGDGMYGIDGRDFYTGLHLGPDGTTSYARSRVWNATMWWAELNGTACANWTSASAGQTGTVGYAGAAYYWPSNMYEDINCSQQARLYCLEQRAPPPGTLVYKGSIVDDGDDGEDRVGVDGDWRSNDPAWNYGMYFGSSGGSFGQAHVGYRFRNVTVAKNATITSAKFVVLQHRYYGSTVASVGTWYGWNVDNAPQFSTTNKPSTIVGANRTTASAPWVDTASPDGYETMVEHDVTPIVQELVNRAGWASGNSMALFALSASPSVSLQYVMDYYSGFRPAMLVIYVGP